MIRSVYDIEFKLNDGLRKSEYERARYVEWLTSYMIHNNISVRKLYELCVKDPQWVRRQALGL